MIPMTGPIALLWGWASSEEGLLFAVKKDNHFNQLAVDAALNEAQTGNGIVIDLVSSKYLTTFKQTDT